MKKKLLIELFVYAVILAIGIVLLFTVYANIKVTPLGVKR